MLPSINKDASIFGFFDSLFDGPKHPNINVSETQDCLTVEAAVPGLTKDDVDVNYDELEQALSICVKSDKIRDENKGQYRWQEIQHSACMRKIGLPKAMYDIEHINANVENGMLKVEVPINHSPEAIRRISVN